MTSLQQNMLTQFAMKISNGHESLSSEISTDGSFESGSCDFNKDDFRLVRIFDGVFRC